MDFHSFRSAFMALLDHHGHTATTADILSAMEAPYLFLQRDGRYVAGVGFFTPEQMHLYLHPQGKQLTPHDLERRALSSFLKEHAPALLRLPENKYLLITTHHEQRVCLTLPTSAGSGEHWMTLATLRRHLPEHFTAYTLDACAPAPVDPLPLLMESARTLSAYAEELLPLLSRTVTRENMRELHARCFRALMVELPPLAQHYHDDMLYENLLRLNHAYRHLFTIDEDAVLLQERLSKKRILQCLTWLRESILDRLYELGAPDELLEQLYQGQSRPE